MNARARDLEKFRAITAAFQAANPGEVIVDYPVVCLICETYQAEMDKFKAAKEERDLERQYRHFSSRHELGPVE